MLKAILTVIMGLMAGANIPAVKVYGQTDDKIHLGNAISRHWETMTHRHIRIIFPQTSRSIADKIAPKAERIYEEYENRLGTAPNNVILYYLGNHELICRARALNTFEAGLIWSSPISKRKFLFSSTPTHTLRYEIATAFKYYIDSSLIKVWHFVLYPPDNIPWQDGLVSFLVQPSPTPRQQRALQTYRSTGMNHPDLPRHKKNKMNIRIGRSQIQYFKNNSGKGSLSDIYTWRKSFLGLFNYFNFKPAFKQAAGITYSSFVKQWRRANKSVLKTDTLRLLRPKQSTAPPLKYSAKGTHKSSVPDSAIVPYHSLLHTRIKIPIIIPYYAGPDDYGLGIYFTFKEPMGIHAFDIAGLFSMARPIHKSYFTFEYINNSFRPRLSLHFNHFSSGTLFIGKYQKTLTTNVLTASSLWKLKKISHVNSNWYFGLRLRYMAFEYLPKRTLHDRYPHLFFRNEKTHQTDLKAVLTWSHIKLNKNTLINPDPGFGIQLSATGADDILGSDVRYLRLNLGTYTIVSAFRKHRLYLYADGVIDIGAPAGRDYLAFANGGRYELTSSKFLGEVNPDFKQFVRGYNTLLTGSRFLFGRVEYRIPFEFNTTRKLFGFIPPARTVFTFFSDAGIMGDASVIQNHPEMRYRWSAGFEVKRVFSFAGNFQFAYELGIGQPLNQPFAPHPYFRVQMAIPF